MAVVAARGQGRSAQSRSARVSAARPTRQSAKASSAPAPPKGQRTNGKRSPEHSTTEVAGGLELGSIEKVADSVPQLVVQKGGRENSGPACLEPGNRTFTGLLRSPLSCGVDSATERLELPRVAVAVKNLLWQARYADLCTTMSRDSHRRAAYPMGTLVDFATDEDGHPLFSLNPLAMHTHNLAADPRCSLVVQMPGWHGLANARATLFGDVHLLPERCQDRARRLFREKHKPGVAGHGTSDHPMWRMNVIRDVYFVGGFGTVSWVGAQEFEEAEADAVVRTAACMDSFVHDLNLKYGQELAHMLSRGEATGAAIVSLDRNGLDIRVQYRSQEYVRRLRFHNPVDEVDAADVEVARVLREGFKD